MSGFGGAVKLTGESEYRRALSQITQNLREVSSQMNVVSSSFSANDKSVEALTAKENVLNQKLEEQTKKLNTLKAQYASMSSQYNEQTSKHTALVNSYNQEKTKLEEIGRTLGTTSKEYKDQEAKVAQLASEVRKSTTAQDANEKSMSKMREQINNAQADCNKTAKEIDNLGKETEETGKQAKEAGDGFTVFKGIVANLASSAIASAVNGLKRLGSALIDVGKQAYNSYAEYEQLVGGVETLFGESADVVQQYAENAYKTAGMSANEYMETVTSFSASLLQGLNGDTAKSAKIADLAITDMSDNANKMGTSMEMIQNAYQGFAKQNYTMLDNLKLGYGGTKTEMLRLVKDAGVVEDSVKSIDEVSFDKIIEAIHIVQTNMGITGTTAKEASSTIEGSTKSVKASWQNLMTAIADENADMKASLKIFTDNVIVMAQNAVPRIKQIVSGLGKAIVSLVKQFMPEVANTVFPIVEKLYNAVKTVATFIINNFNKIIPVVLTAVAVFTAFNAVMAISKTITAVTTAMSGLTAGVGLATKAQTLWNASMSANPIGAVIMAVTALIAVLVVLSNTLESEVSKAHKEEMKTLNAQADAINENTEAWENLKDAQKQSVDAGMTEMSHYESLYDELQDIVDANGKVKKGYEERASFITSQLANALGIEIEMVDGVIQEYGTLREEIDKTMEKKKAQIILDSQESLYKEAITKQAEALRTLNTAQDEYDTKKRESADLEKKVADELNALSEATSQNEILYHKNRLDMLYEEQTAKAEELALAESNYNAQKELLSEYAYNIGQYEQNMALMHAERYDEMSTVNWDYVSDFQDAGDAQKAQLEADIKNTETNLALLKELKEKSGSDIYDAQIKANEKLLKEQQESMKKYDKATEKGLDTATIEWKDGLDDQLSELTGAKIEFKEGADGLVQAYVNGVAEGEPKSKKEMAQLVTDTIKEISKQETGAKTAGEDLIDGVNNGIANERKQSGVFNTIWNFGSKLLGNLRASMQEHSPSKATKEMGEYLLEGLGLGIKAQEDATLKQVSSVGQHVVEALNSELSQGANIGEIAVSSNARNSASQGNYYNMVSAFKEALSDMKIVLDDEVAGAFVDRTVTRLIYN